ncbi:MAG: FAD-dependent oxidoreductase [Verrucomicrobiales bacterium]|nr:FAD-dependent oxidoreductase [Verrucomicrobiales bacterium]
MRSTSATSTSEPVENAFDFAVIGGGSAGYAAARTAAAAGLQTVVIDGAEELGGLCILRGCMPSKTLIESANRALTVRRAAEFGLAANLDAVNTAFIRDRKRRLIAEFAGFRQEQLQSGRFALRRGTARFLDSNRIEITLRDGGTAALHAKTFLIAAGSEISIPAVPGLTETGFWTSDTLLDAAEIPESFIVLGGGAIALELAHYLGAIGRRVTVIQRSAHLLSFMDSDVADVVESNLRTRGLEVFTGASLTKIQQAGGLKQVHISCQGKSCVAEGAEILLALGRIPATRSLGLDAAGVRLDGRRIAVTPTQQTSAGHIFAAGDVCGPLEVVHVAIQQAEIAARNAAALVQGGLPHETVDYRLKLFGVFTHPEVASVGLSEKEAATAGRAVLSAKYPFNDHGKSMVAGETEGFVKLLAAPDTGEILGASVVGPHATELIHEVTVAMRFRATAGDFAAIPHYHPTLSEIWTYPAEEIAEAVARSSTA